ncbi:MAG: serine dehydratase, partial [Firmicutes bacterium]|nr:serine dehydratase [Bacillota bacterium]
MLSIRSLYQIGYGPSSSHTMGPAKAIKIIKDQFPDLDFYEITLYNSLALTGKGHLTEEAIKDSLAPCRVTFLTSIDIHKHPNTLLVKGYQNQEIKVEKEIQSVGGGRIVFVGEEDIEKSIYPHNNFKDIKKYCRSHNMSLSEYIFMVEGEGFEEFLSEIWEAMKRSIINGIANRGVLPGPLKMKRKAPDLYSRNSEQEV